jgi:hypothetical protein
MGNCFSLCHRNNTFWWPENVTGICFLSLLKRINALVDQCVNMYDTLEYSAYSFAITNKLHVWARKPKQRHKQRYPGTHKHLYWASLSWNNFHLILRICSRWGHSLTWDSSQQKITCVSRLCFRVCIMQWRKGKKASSGACSGSVLLLSKLLIPCRTRRKHSKVQGASSLSSGLRFQLELQ